MKTLEQFNEFVKEINKENGRNYKIDILQKYKENDAIKYYLNYIFNPYIITGISDKKLNKNIRSYSMFDSISFEEDKSVKEVLEYLKTHNTGRDEDLRIVQNLKNSLPEELSNLFGAVVTKTLSIGLNTKSINSVIENLIPTFNVQLANKYFDKPEVVEGRTFALTTKIDGGRIIAIKENGQVNFYTRQGQPYEGLVDLEKEMLEKLPDNICLDGEITLLDKGNLVSKDQYKQTMKITRTKNSEKHGICMKVFDILSVEDFKNQTNTVTYKDRRTLLEKIFSSNTCTYFKILPILYQGNDINKIQEILHKQVDKGEEGIMINLLDDFYQFKRSNSLLKVKLFNDTEVQVLKLEPGTGKYSNTLGNLVCSYKNNILKVGSGLSDEQRDYYWNNPDAILNKLVTVQYFEETYNSATNLPSLRFPVFLRIKED